MSSPVRLHGLSRAALLFFFILLLRAASAESDEDWTPRVWQMDDGLPSANVTGIAQTRDGFLWLATQSGLARFDGLTFNIVKIPVGRDQPIIRAMLCDPHEDFWLAESGGALVHFGPGVAKLFGSRDGLPNALALQLVETPDRSVWVAYDDGSVFRVSQDDKVVKLTESDGLNSDGICSFTLDVHETLWYAKGSDFGCLQNGHFQKLGSLDDRNPQILGSRDGGIWFCTSSEVLKLHTNRVPETVINFADAVGSIKPSVLFEDYNGHLWIGTVSQGLFLLSQTNLLKVDTSQNKIHAVFRDQEGSIWVGTDGGGLNRMQPKVIELHGRDENLPFETVRSLSEDRNTNLWVVTQDGALTKFPGGDWSQGAIVDNWPGSVAHNVVTDHAGAIWIGTYRRGLFCFEDGHYSRFTTAKGLAGTTVRSLMVDSRNNLWIGLENDVLQRLHNGIFETFQQPPNSRAVRAIAEDSSGQIWFGTLGGSLLRVDGERLLEVPPPAGTATHSIRCLATTPDGSLWIGYAVNGVGRLKNGKWSSITQEQGLFDGNICAMMPDSEGRMWFASDRGIFFVKLSQLNDVAEGRETHVQSVFYGRDAGLPGLQAYYGYWPGALATRSGRLLFPTHSGVAEVYPERVRTNGKPPHVLVESVLVDGREAFSGTNVVAKFPPNHRKIEIAFTATSFIAPEQVQFRYCLAGWTHDWSDAAPVRTAAFPRLPPGHYQFQVTACNSQGVWNDNPAVFDFTVTPFYWQGWPFRLSVFAAALVLGVAVVRHTLLRRVRKLLQHVEQEAALQKERTRIAQDMHDELGARFTQISLLGELSRNALADPEKARDFLDQISRLSHVGVRSLDEIVWAVNPSHDTLIELLGYTGQYARDFLAAAGIECRLEFPDALPDQKVSGEIRHSVFLIVKETLNNVVKHARAHRVRIIFETGPARSMRWLIMDDGQGFAGAPETTLADGLRNIRRRAATLGGQAGIESEPGKGTRVILEIPLPK